MNNNKEVIEKKASFSMVILKAVLVYRDAYFTGGLGSKKYLILLETVSLKIGDATSVPDLKLTEPKLREHLLFICARGGQGNSATAQKYYN
jgi:hypothetical protein